MQSLLYSTLLAGATFLWGYLFYKQDFHPQPLRKILQIFQIGLFSVLPVFAYRELYQSYLPRLAEYGVFEPILENPVLEGIFFFAANMLLLSALLFIFTGTLTVILTFCRHDTLENIRQAVKGEEMEFVTVSMMLGLLVYFESVFERWFDVPIVGSVLGLTLFLAIIEEYIKHLTVRFVDDKQLRDIDDAITFSVMVGLAFSLIETFIYASNGVGFSAVMYRALLSTPIHLIASGIFGYYYGLAHFAEPIVKRTEVGKVICNPNRTWLCRVLTLNRTSIYRQEKMVEGLALATLFHGTCNIMFEFGLAFLVVPIVVAGLFVVSSLYRQGHVLYRSIKSQ